MSKGKEDSILKTELTEEEAKLLAEISDHIAALSSDEEKNVETALKELSALLESPSDTAVVAIPKALKFVRRFYPVLKDRFIRLSTDSPLRPLLADILALITITFPREDGSYESLKYKLQGTTTNLWGHEFLRAIEGDVATAIAAGKAAIAAAAEAKAPAPEAGPEALDAHRKVIAAADTARDEMTRIYALVDVMVPLEMRRNAEPFGCDLLLECDRLRDITKHVTEHNWRRIGLYLTSVALYQPHPEDRDVLVVAKDVYLLAAGIHPTPPAAALSPTAAAAASGAAAGAANGGAAAPAGASAAAAPTTASPLAREALPLALRVAMRLGTRPAIDEVLAHPAAVGALRRQLAAMLARGRHFVFTDADDDAFELGANKALSGAFTHAARALDHAVPRGPDDVLKAQAPRSGYSAQLNLARAFANAFANAAHVTDSIYSPPPAGTEGAFGTTGSEFIHANDDAKKFTAVAALGVTNMWDVDRALGAATPYLEASDTSVRGGAHLAVGIAQCGVQDESEAALGLLRGSVDSSEPTQVRVGAILGLGCAYIASNHTEVVDELVGLLDTSEPTDVYTYAALALGFVTCGHVNERFIEAAMALLADIDPTEGNATRQLWFVVLGLALSFIGAGDAVEPSLDFAATLHPHVAALTELALLSFAYCGSGHVVVMQRIARTVARLIGESNALDAAKKEVDDRVKADGAAGAATTRGRGGQDGLSRITATLETLLRQTQGGGAGDGDDSDGSEAGGHVVGPSNGVVGPVGGPLPNPGSGASAAVTPTPAAAIVDATPPGAVTDAAASPPAGGDAAAAATSAADAAQAAADAEVLRRHAEGLKERDGPIAMGVLGIALVALGESCGAQMAPRLLQHILQLGTAGAKQAIPLAIALLHTSHPAPHVMSLLEKFTHSDDTVLSRSAVAAIGICGAGSNNARATSFLRELSSYYGQSSPNMVLVVRLSLSLLSLGKGLLSLSPLHCDNFCVDRAAICGLVTYCFTILSADDTLFKDGHFLPLLLAVAANPRLCMALDATTGEPMTDVPLLVGKAVDTVAMVGQPKGITGFHHHNTPVVLHADSRAELRTGEFVTYSPMLEGIVLAEKNTAYEGEDVNK